MGTERSLSAYYRLMAGVLLLGLAPVATKLLLEGGLPAESIVSLRYLVAVLCLLPPGVIALRRRTPTEPPRSRDWVVLVLVGALGSGAGALLFTWALKYSSTGVVNAISKTAPIFVAFLSQIVLQERISGRRLGLVLAMVGADALMGLGELAYSPGEARTRLVGDALALLAGLSRAVAEILGKESLARFPASVVTLARFSVGLVVTGVTVAYTGAYRGLGAVTGEQMGLVVVLGAGLTALAMYLYYSGTAQVPVHVAVSLKTAGVVVTAVASWLVLGEALNLYHVAGVGVLISGSYLLVLRSSREHAWAETGSMWDYLAGLQGHFRTRLTVLILSFALAAAVLTSVISVHTTGSMVREQVRLTLGKMAAVLVQLGGVQEPVARTTLQQYLNGVVMHRIEGRAFSVDLLYIIWVRGESEVLTFAVNDQLSLKGSDGQPYRAGDAHAARRLLAMARDGSLERDYDVLPVRAQLRRPGEGVVAMVEIGCRRSLTNQAIAQIVARNTTAVFLLALAGLLLARGLASRVAGPLERLGTDLARLSGGDLGVPLAHGGPADVRAMGEALGRVREGLRRGSGYREVLLRLVERQVWAEGIAEGKPEVPEEGGVALVVERPAELPGSVTRGSWTAAVLDGVLAYSGQVLGGWRGCVVVWWPVEGQEGAWTGLLAADEVRGRLAEVGLGLRAAVEVVESDPSEALGAMRQWWRVAPVEAVRVGEALVELVGHSPALRRSEDGSGWVLGDLGSAGDSDVADVSTEA